LKLLEDIRNLIIFIKVIWKLTVEDLDIEIGWLRGLPLGAVLTGCGSLSNEGNRGVSGGVSNL
jgi:hypothetical protein